MSEQRTFVIVGASLAGAKAAETLRREGFDGRIVLIGEEHRRPYERPPLSKEVLRAEKSPDVAYVHPDTYYADHDIDLRLSSRAESIDVVGRRVLLNNGERLPYDSVLLTTGASPRRLSLPGAGLAGVRYLRTLDDSEALSAAIRPGRRVVVIGAGWIGCEVAASARQMGAEVAMVDMVPVPLGRALGPDIGAFYRDVHADHGVELHLGVGIEELRGSSSVSEVVLSDGTRIDADLVVIGVGVAPRTELADAAGLELDNGVVTDEYLRTSVPDIYAAGDVANAWHPVLRRRVRLEHWSSAHNQGRAAARNMLGRDVAYEKIPFFYSDQYDVGMEYSGFATDQDELVLRGDPSSGAFVAFWLRDGRLAAGMHVNVWGVIEPIASLVASGAPVDRRGLVDPDVDLAALAALAEAVAADAESEAAAARRPDQHTTT